MESLEVMNDFEKYLYDSAILNRIPISGTLELTPLCNMNCDMCYIRLSKDEQERRGNLLSGKEWISFAKNAVNNGTLFILLTGGEPLLHPDFKEIYVEIKKMGVHITINTNGTLINDEIIELFEKYPPRRINITLYGKNDDTYLKLCKYPQGYSKVIKAIRLLKEKNIQVKLNCTISKLNYNDFNDILNFADSLNLPIEIPYYLFPKNRNHHKDNDFKLTAKEAAKLRFDTLLYYYNYDCEKVKKEINKTLNYIDNYSFNEKNEMPKGFWCASRFNSFWINWKGYVTSCGMIENPGLDILKMDFKHLWERLVKLTGEVELSKECFACKYHKLCNSCAAAMQSETGNYNKVPKYKCEIKDVGTSL